MFGSVINFRKTNSVDFASEFHWFGEWLGKNSIKIDSFKKESVLKKERDIIIPSFPEDTSKEILNNTYFLDDIHVIFYRGIPYESPRDYITTAEYTDEEEISVDASTHVLRIPNPSNIISSINKEDFSSDYNIVSKVSQIKSKIEIEHKSLSDIKLENIEEYTFNNKNGIQNGETLSESLTKINDSMCWIDLEDNPDVFLTSDGERLLYNNGWYVLANS